MWVSEHGVEDREPAGPGETVQHSGHLIEGILWSLLFSRSMILMGVGSWLPKDVSSMYLLREEEPLDPADHGTGC